MSYEKKPIYAQFTSCVQRVDLNELKCYLDFSKIIFWNLLLAIWLVLKKNFHKILDENVKEISDINISLFSYQLTTYRCGRYIYID